MASRGRPKKQLTYDKAAAKRLNERLRKIEKVYGTGSSRYYQSLQNRLESHPNSTTSKAYKYEVDYKTGETKIRLLNKTEFMAAPKSVQEAVLSELKRGLEAKTTTKIGMEISNHNSAEGLRNSPIFGEGMSGYSDFEIGEHFKEYQYMKDWIEMRQSNIDDVYLYNLMTSGMYVGKTFNDKDWREHVAKKIGMDNDTLKMMEAQGNEQGGQYGKERKARRR